MGWVLVAAGMAILIHAAWKDSAAPFPHVSQQRWRSLRLIVQAVLGASLVVAGSSELVEDPAGPWPGIVIGVIALSVLIRVVWNEFLARRLGRWDTRFVPRKGRKPLPRRRAGRGSHHL